MPTIFAAFPVGNYGTTTNPDFDVARLDGRAVVNENSGSMRIDYRHGDKDNFYIRWFRDQGVSTAPFDVSGSFRTSPRRNFGGTGMVSFFFVFDNFHFVNNLNDLVIQFDNFGFNRKVIDNLNAVHRFVCNLGDFSDF